MLIRKLEQKALECKNRIAIETVDKKITYHQLNCWANQLARVINSSYPVSGNDAEWIDNAVGLLLDHGENQVAGLLATLKAGKIYVPLDSTYPDERLAYMIENAGVGMILTTSGNMDKARQLMATVAGGENIKVLAMDEIDFKTVSTRNLDPVKRDADEDPPAYIIYTSGSTGQPKGVFQTLNNTLFYAERYIESLSITSEDRCTYMASFSHDGAVQDIYSALLSGATLCPLDIRGKYDITHVGKWLAEKEITFYHSVVTVFRYMAGALDGELTFPKLRLIVTGGERLQVEDVRLARTFFPGVIFAHMYGQSESSVNTMGFIDTAAKVGKITLGKPLEGIELLVLDDEGEEVNPYQVGEIYVACPHLSPGYWRKPKETEAVFFEDEELGPLYQTGDLGRVNLDGSIEFVGRKDHQVKIRGFRVELPEIERLLLDYCGIKEAVVAAVEKDTDEAYLYAYVVPEKYAPGEPEPFPGAPESQELSHYLAEHLPDYMIPDHFHFLPKIPMTPTGKIDRKSLPEPEKLKANTYTCPRDHVEERLEEIWSNVLEVDKQNIGIDAEFFEIGGHSLKATVLIHQIQKAFHVRIPLAEVFEKRTIRHLAELIKETKPVRYDSIAPTEKKEYYPQSPAQRRLYILDRFENAGTNYNISHVLIIKGFVNKDDYETAFNKLIERHESLRTSFHLVKDVPVQRIHPANTVDFKLEYFRITDDILKCGDGSEPCVSSETTVINDFIRPFDLSRAPLLRVGLAELSEEEHLLLFDMHHIVSDGTSMSILADDFISLFNKEELPQMEIQYKDFAIWQEILSAKGKIAVQEEYWQEMFPHTDDIPILEFPTDFPRPGVFSHDGGEYTFKLEGEVVSRLKTWNSRMGSSLYMTLLAAFNILLYKYTGQTDIVVGTGVQGRPHVDLQGILGMFVNTLAIRNRFQCDQTGRQLLNDVKNNCLKAFDNQDVQFEDLVDKLQPQRNPDRNPLFDVALIVQNFDNSRKEMGEVTVTPYPMERKTTRFDFTIFVSEVDNHIHFLVEYSRALFTEETIQRMSERFLIVTNRLIEKADIKIHELEILTEAERFQLLFEFNETASDYPRGKTIQQLFEEQVEKTPENIALVGAALFARSDTETGECLPETSRRVEKTYCRLNQRANQVAHLLKSKGVSLGTLTAIRVERSVDMVIAILGVIKAGGAYLPVAMDYPKERVEYMLKDSNAHILLTSRSASGSMVLDTAAEEILVDENGGVGDNPDNPAEVSGPGDPAYVIYTSGTTGKPKGTIVEHRALVNLCSWHNHFFDVHESDNATQYAGAGFDAAVWEMFPYLVSGATFHIICDSIKLDIDALIDYFNLNHITVSFLPTQFCQQFMEEANDIPSLRLLLAGGDKLNRFTPRKYRLFNNYGPTENTVVTTSFPVETSMPNIPIGKPIANVQVYILCPDRLTLQAVGVAGELCIGGDSLARGYLNNPELTAEKFYRTGNSGTDNSSDLSHLPVVIYRTGDRARWLKDGNIEFMGRIDHQVKIRGFRIELGEIENLLLTHKAVKEVVVIDRKSNHGKGDAFLCAYIVPEPGTNLPSDNHLNEFLAAHLPNYMIPTFFITLDAIPLTPNGKINKRALPEPELSGPDMNNAVPTNEMEEKLLDIWAEVLETNRENIGTRTDFFTVGGHSLKAVSLVNAIHKNFNVKIDIQGIFKAPTITGQTLLIHQADVTPFMEIEPLPVQDYYELSYTQQRIWVLQQLNPESGVFNMPGIAVLDDDVDETMVRGVLARLVYRHESFRTYFKEEGEAVVQVVLPATDLNEEAETSVLGIDLQVVDLTSLTGQELEQQLDERLAKERQVPFTMDTPPLFRVKLLKTGLDTGDMIIFNMHHIISDGWSMDVLQKEFTHLYQSAKKGSTGQLPPLRIQYKDYAYWHNRLLEDRDGMTRAIEFWKGQLDGELPVPGLIYDVNPSDDVEKRSAGYRVVIPTDITEKLRDVALNGNASMFIVLLAGFNLLLASLKGQKEIVMGMPGAARRHEDLKNIIGLFVNTLILVNRIDGEETFTQFLERVRSNTLQVLEYQDYPMEMICDELKIKYPKLNVFFNMVNIGSMGSELITDFEAFHREAAQDTKFHLTFYVSEHPNGIEIVCNYFAGLFKPETIEILLRVYMRILQNIAADPDKPVSQYHKTRKKGKLKRMSR